MAIRSIRTEEDEILRKKSKEVDVIDDRIRELVKDMVETMHKYDGVGLAAVQVGILKQIIVIDLYDEKPVIKIINPKIIKTKGEQEVDEGCLSFPNKYVKVKITGTGLLAQAISHEVDHLHGIVLTDVMIPGTMEYITPDSIEERKSKK